MDVHTLPSLRTLGLATLFLGACFNPESPTADDGGSESETGDGDGDTTGDGDGDTMGDGDGDGDGDTMGDGDGDGDGDQMCTVEGCECDIEMADSCDPGLYCKAGECTAPVCNNGEVEPGEECEDGNDVDGDGCDNDCTNTEVLYVDASYQNTCVLIEGGRVRCFGANYAGQLGYGHTENIGDDETPAAVGDVALPEPGVELTMGDSHSCILMADMAVRCWGTGGSGQLGYGNTENIGDDEFPNSISDIQIGGAALEVDAGGTHTCARLANGKLRCWGLGFNGQLGYGNTDSIGDDEPPSTAGDIPVGAAVIAQATGIGHTCAITANGAIRCWGTGSYGRLGYGDTESVGAMNTPQQKGNVPAVPAGLDPTTNATALALGYTFTCALYETGDVLCWGLNSSGQLGQGMTENIGDDELPGTFEPIPLPAPAVAISAGDNHLCALLDNDEAVCWGANSLGQLGVGSTDNIGDDETPGDVGTILLPGPVKQIDAGGSHTCAIMAETNEVLCWGSNSYGQLGYGDTENIGDDEMPQAKGPIELL